ncbi:MAG: 30S ribosomal protein S3 [Firmicutes bacterium]|jgi:small subunit ribosomal protein S3|nr:30S ribosomal protein S3 [Bacillota bacterium]
MGQKVSPVGFRIGIIRNWDATWYAEKDYARLLHEDIRVRDYIQQKLANAGISRIEIERVSNNLKLNIHTAKPGMVIGRGGTEVDRLKKDLEKMTGRNLQINIFQIKTPELDAYLVAESIASQLVRRIAFRRAMKQAIFRTIKEGARGIKVLCSGRLGGNDMARTESYMEGTVPLQTLRADIDYGFAEAHTTYGRIGVKVWIFKGEILPQKEKTIPEGGDRNVDAQTG